MKRFTLKSISKGFKRWIESAPGFAGGELSVVHSTLGAKVIRANGTIEDLGIVCRRKVTQAFVADLVSNMVTETAAFGDYKYHRAGIDTTAEANDDVYADFNFTGCPSAATGDQNTGGSGATVTYISVGTISFTSTLAITSHGIANGSDFSTATIMDRSVFSAINVVNGDSIQFTYTLTINAES